MMERALTANYVTDWAVLEEDKCNYGTWWDYHLYCDFSIHTIVEI